MTREIRHTVQQALWDMEIPYMKANAEADDALSELVGSGKLDVVVSSDMDFLLSGVPRLWIPFRTANDGAGADRPAADAGAFAIRVGIARAKGQATSLLGPPRAGTSHAPEVSRV